MGVLGKRVSSEWRSVSQAAELLGISTRTVRRWIHQGKLDADLRLSEHGPQYFIAQSAIDALRRSQERASPLEGLLHQIGQLHQQFAQLQQQLTELQYLHHTLRQEYEALLSQLISLREESERDGK